MNIQLVIFRLVQYIRYWLMSVDEHSLQSPFAFEVYTKFLKAGSGSTVKDSGVEGLRKQLRHSSIEIALPSKGASSSLSAKKSKKLSQIIKHGISNFDTSRILSNLIAYSQSKIVLELGTSVGLNTLYMSKVQCVQEVITIEADAELCALAIENFKSTQVNNITLLNTEIDIALANFKESRKKFDFVYVDANHTFDATIRYFRALKSLCSSDGIMVFDDINWSIGMKEAWHVIKDEMEIGLTFENADMGIVFLRPIENKLNYIARF